MPELPEVETVVRTIRPLVKNKVIKEILVFFNKLVKEPSDLETFKQKIKNQTINDVQRIGKHIIFVLDDYVLISHLRMEGKYYFFASKIPHCLVDDENIMAKITFRDNTYLLYHDTRRFGTLHLQDKTTYLQQNPIQKVGPEPWDKKCSANYLYNRLQKKTLAIKSALLDQTIMAGLGNIYVNEVLHWAKINPYTPSKKLSLQQVKKILYFSRKILKKAIELGGTTIASYTSSLGVSGKFQNHLLVHSKVKKTCPSCQKTTIVKVKINGRGTYYCPSCQK